MSNAFLHPFVEANACTTCPNAKFTSAANSLLECEIIPTSVGSEYLPECTPTYDDRENGLRKVVDNWIAGGATRATVVARYGQIQDWNMLQVTSMLNLFYQSTSFNAGKKRVVH